MHIDKFGHIPLLAYKVKQNLQKLASCQVAKAAHFIINRHTLYNKYM